MKTKENNKIKPNENFYQIPHELLNASSLDSDELIMYSVIASYTRANKTCWVTNLWFSEKLKCCEKTVSTKLKRLENLGLIKRIFINKNESTKETKRILQAVKDAEYFKQLKHNLKENESSITSNKLQEIDSNAEVTITTPQEIDSNAEVTITTPQEIVSIPQVTITTPQEIVTNNNKNNNNKEKINNNKTNNNINNEIKNVDMVNAASFSNSNQNMAEPLLDISNNTLHNNTSTIKELIGHNKTLTNNYTSIEGNNSSQPITMPKAELLKYQQKHEIEDEISTYLVSNPVPTSNEVKVEPEIKSEEIIKNDNNEIAVFIQPSIEISEFSSLEAKELYSEIISNKDEDLLDDNEDDETEITIGCNASKSNPKPVKSQEAIDYYNKQTLRIKIYDETVKVMIMNRETKEHLKDSKNNKIGEKRIKYISQHFPNYDRKAQLYLSKDLISPLISSSEEYGYSELVDLLNSISSELK